ncbi:MAG: hypothetical protein HQ522_05370 [Bacteroidetes bacterium]|nr:hypothetical protein [Bacteroidota bacterium]
MKRLPLLLLVCTFLINATVLGQSINFKGKIVDNANDPVKGVQVCTSYKLITKVISNRKGVFKLGISGNEPLIFYTPNKEIFSVPVKEAIKGTFIYNSDEKQIRHNNTTIKELQGEEKELALTYFANPFSQFSNIFKVIEHECPSVVIDYDNHTIFPKGLTNEPRGFPKDPFLENWGALILMNGSPTTFQNVELLSPSEVKSVTLLKRPEELHIYKTQFGGKFSSILKIQTIDN